MKELLALAIVLLPFIVIFLMWRKIRKLKQNSGMPLLETSDFHDSHTYKQKYRYRSAKRFREELKVIKEKQKALKSSGKAVSISAYWAVGLDKKADKNGETLTKQSANLMLLAFDAESDAIISEAKFDNFDRLKEQLSKTFAAINKNGTIIHIAISEQYLELKFRQLELEHKYAIKDQQEKEYLRAIKEEEKENLKAQRELEKARKKAEQAIQDNKRKKAELEAMLAKDRENEALKAQIAQLEQFIEDNKRAISMAEQTKAGRIYVISNIGSFGENTYKIGMTRRLKPEERVKELGDASVPFPFDIHAFIWSEDAPKLEKELHRMFAKNQVNRVNPRKEFFNVSFDEIRTAVEKMGVEFEFVSEFAEATEYRQSLELQKSHKYADIDEVDYYAHDPEDGEDSDE